MSNSSELAAVMARLSQIDVRLSRLEASGNGTKADVRSHPSLDKLSIAEAIADSIFGSELKEKACTFEPNDKPCDHCSMCSSRGF